MSPRRRIVLGLALALTVALSVQSLLWTPESGAPASASDIVQPVGRARAATLRAGVPALANVTGAAGATATAAAGDAAPHQSMQLLARPVPPRSPHDLFAAYSWQPPPPPPAPVEPPAPQAPPLPFLYTGRIEVDGRSIFLLLEGERTHRVAIGGLVGEFKLISSGPQGLEFLHQPTGLTQVLAAPGVPIASVN